jgi:hypothetical protein
MFLPNPSTPSLAKLQRQLRRVFTEPHGIRVALEKTPSVLPLIATDPPLSVEHRLGIYSDAYFLRLLECLETDFPATRRLIGPERFAELAADFLQRHPSTSPNVSDLGAQLPSFLQTHSLTTSFPYITELATLEWGVLESIYSERLSDLDPGEFSRLPTAGWPSARFHLDPSVRFFSFAWEVDRLWTQRREPDLAPLSPLGQKPRCLVVYRDGQAVQLEILSNAQRTVLTAIRENLTLEMICRQLLHSDSDVQDVELMGWFAAWVRAGVIKRIYWGVS